MIEKVDKPSSGQSWTLGESLNQSLEKGARSSEQFAPVQWTIFQKMPSSGRGDMFPRPYIRPAVAETAVRPLTGLNGKLKRFAILVGGEH